LSGATCLIPAGLVTITLNSTAADDYEYASGNDGYPYSFGSTNTVTASVTGSWSSASWVLVGGDSSIACNYNWDLSTSWTHGSIGWEWASGVYGYAAVWRFQVYDTVNKVWVHSPNVNVSLELDTD